MAEGSVVTAQDLFRALLRDHVAPGLRVIGFTGSGQRYRWPSETHFCDLSFQRWPYSTRDEVRFTANVSVMPRTAWEIAVAALPGLPERPPGTGALSVHVDGEELDLQQWYRRIGHFMPLSWDEWWRLPAGADPAPIGDDVLRVVRDHGLPAMLAHMAGDDRR